jgi:hypothetical protein
VKIVYLVFVFVLASLSILEAETVETILLIADSVPLYLPESQQKALISRRTKLEEWRLDLESRIQAHNGVCRHVASDAWALLGDCRQLKIRLEEERDEYQKALNHYREWFNTFCRLPGEKASLRQLPERNIKYFMLGNHFEFIDFEPENMPTRVWPGPKNPEKRVIDIYAPEVEKNDLDLLKSLDYSSIDFLSVDQVVQIINARHDAREREAMRISARTLIEERTRLMQEGVIKPGENIIRKEKLDTEFYRLMKGIYQRVAEKEIQDIHKADQLVFEEFGDIANRREKARDPELMRRKFAERNDIIEFYNMKMKDIEQRSSQNFSGKMEKLQNKGYYKEGEDLLEKDASDLRFRKAAQKTVKKVSIQKRRDENSAFGLAFKELKEVCYIEKIQPEHNSY